MFQRELDQVVAPVLRNAVPDGFRTGRAIRQGIKPTFNVAVIPAVKRRARDAQLIECSLDEPAGHLPSYCSLSLRAS